MKVSPECPDKQKQEIHVTNMTCLDIQVNFCLEKPFSFVHCDDDAQFLVCNFIAWLFQMLQKIS